MPPHLHVNDISIIDSNPPGWPPRTSDALGISREFRQLPRFSDPQNGAEEIESVTLSQSLVAFNGAKPAFVYSVALVALL